MPGRNRKTPVLDDSHPFAMPWLDSCYQETMLPNGEWPPVLDKLTDALAPKIEKQFQHTERKQMIFELLGIDFVMKYFPNENYNPHLITPPAITEEARIKLVIDAQKWLQHEMDKAADEIGCQRMLQADEEGKELSEEMKNFLQRTGLIFNKGLQRHLYLQEHEVEKQWNEALWRQQQAKEARIEARERRRLQAEYNRLRGSTYGVRGILKIPPSRQSSTSSIASSRATTANVKGAMFGASEDPPVFFGMQSNSMGRSVIAILKRDPRRFNEVVDRLHGRQLPGQLRNYIWMDILLKHEREKINDAGIEKIVRERFGKAVSRGMTELRIKRATHSPISGLIDNAVIEIYDRTPAMRCYITDNQHMKEAAKALNVLYVYDRSYEPYLVHWLFPLQLAFQDTSGEGEQVYELAMCLDLLNKGCFHKWPAVFAIAEKVMERLHTVDPDFHDHLKQVAQIDPTVNPKEFLVQLIHQEKSKAEALIRTPTGQNYQDHISKELLADPLIFLRKWVGEGFVGVLDTQAAVFVWDQCFMSRWHPIVMEDVCLTVLMLLRYKFMETDNYTSMRDVFLNEPCKLYTLDIQRGWIHIQKDRPIRDVEGMNRQKQRLGESPVPKSPASDAGTTLAPVGIKGLRLTLVINAEALEREKYLNDIQPRGIKLVSTVFFGSVRLRSKTSVTLPIAKKIEVDKYGAKTYLFDFPKEKFIFRDLDPSMYDLEAEMGGYPNAIVRVDYSYTPSVTGRVTATATPVTATIGWAKIKLYQQLGRGSMADGQWSICAGDSHYKVYAGIPTERNNATPNGDVNGALGPESQFGAFIFDPDNEAPTPAPTPIVEKQPTPPPPAQQTPVPPPVKSPIIPGLDDPFYLYIDKVSNIPDNATIVKVTGRIIKTGEISGLTDLLALPTPESKARSPQFKYRFLVNENKAMGSNEMLVLLRVYTIDTDTKDLVVIGSALFQMFDTKNPSKLKVGGHCRQLFSGMPDLKQGIRGVTEDALDSHARIPGCSLYFRLQAETEDYENPPDINEVNYPRHDPQLNSSERHVVQTYDRDRRFPPTVNAMVAELKANDDENVTVSADTTAGYLRERLDNKKWLQPNVPAANLELFRLVRYRIDMGLFVNVSGAFGLPENHYIQCIARILPGKDARAMPPTSEGYGKDEKLVTQKHVLDAPQKSPRWMDDAKEMHPHSDMYSVLLVQILSMKAQYTALPGHDGPGNVTGLNGNNLSITDDDILGWAIVPLFERWPKWDYVLSAMYQVPIYKGKPMENALDAFSDTLPEEVILSEEFNKTQTKMVGASLIVEVWDGHFEKEHIPNKLRVLDFLLGEDNTEYDKAKKDDNGKKFSAFIVNSLDKKYQKLGTNNNPMYEKEKDFYQDAMAKAFYNEMHQTS